MPRRHRALPPRVCVARAAVIDQAQALALRILEVEREAPIALGDLACFRARGAEMLLPPLEAFRAGNAQRGASERMRATLLARRRPIEEGEVGAGPRQRVGIEQMVRAGVVLVD